MVMLDQVKRAGRAAKLITKLAGLVTVSVLASGCSLLPFGHSKPSKESHALRPQVHETTPNSRPDCIAAIHPNEEELVEPPVAVETPREAGGCSNCGCKGEKSAVSAVTPMRANVGESVGSAAENELQKLMDGNKRFVEGESENVYNLPQRPGEATRRTPKAMILACSDWEIQPETAFDVLMGDVFVVRVVGNSAALDSVEYAIHRYDIPLILVVGHESCGAVKDHELHTNIEKAVARLREAAPNVTVAGAFYNATNGQITIESEAKPEVAVAPRD
jgi:hypothetical protein